MYGKIVEGRLIAAPKMIKDGGTITYNPPIDILLRLGYLPVVNVPCPEAPEGYYYEHSWTELDGTITDVWTLTKLPDDATPDEIAEALEAVL